MRIAVAVSSGPLHMKVVEDYRMNESFLVVQSVLELHFFFLFRDLFVSLPTQAIRNEGRVS